MKAINPSTHKPWQLLFIALLPIRDLDLLALCHLAGLISCYLSQCNYNVRISDVALVSLTALILICLAVSNSDLAILRYVLWPLAWLALSNTDPKLLGRTILSLMLLTGVIVLADLLLLDRKASFLYRASMVDIHFNRLAGPFLYPGDLGWVAAVFIMYTVFELEKKNISVLQSIFFISLAACLIVASQSRMGVAATAIFLALYCVSSVASRGANLLIWFFFMPLMLTLSFAEIESLDLAYLMKDSPQLMIAELADGRTDSRFKRVTELSYIFSFSSDSGETPFHESTVASFKSKFGGIITLFIYLGASLFLLRRSLINGRTAFIGVAVIQAFSLVNATVDRPKMMLVTFAALAIFCSPWRHNRRKKSPIYN